MMGARNQNATQSIYLKRQEEGKEVACRAAKERHEKEQSEFRGRSERSGSKTEGADDGLITPDPLHSLLSL